MNLEDYEKSLKETVSRLSTLQRIAGIGFWEWNIASGELYWSDEIFRIFGVARHNFSPTYEGFLDSVHPDDRQAVTNAVAMALSGEREAYDVEHRVLQPNGREVFVREQGSVRRGPDGKALSMFGTVMDISERKSVELAFQQSQAQFEILWNATQNAMLTISENGVITRLNKMAIKQFGYSAEELLGQSVEILVPEKVRGQHVRLREEFNRNALSRPMAAGFELFALRKGGIRFPVEISLTPVDIFGSKETLVHVEDVSRRYELEGKLRQSQKLEALGRLAGGIAHDLNNMLTVIIGFSELSTLTLEEGHECQEHVREVHKAGERARELVRQILAFTKQQVLDWQLVDLSQLMLENEEMLRQLVPRQHAFELNMTEGLRRVHTDPTQVVQVITNLVVNACDAMQHAGRLIISMNNVLLDKDYMEDAGRLESGNFVEISITDTGCGMDEETVQRIFDPFFTTKSKGTGLGLATVYGIVKQSKGEVMVFSELNKGTTFKIYFPIADSKVLADSTAEDGDGQTNTATGNILLIEDDASIKTLTIKVLSDAGYDVIDFTSGEHALEYLENQGASSCADLIITDIVLGGMTGYDFYLLLREKGMNIPVIFMSGFAERALDAISAIEDKSVFLHKPFSRKDLLQKVRDNLKR